MNRQVNPDHCYETDDGATYMLDAVHDTPEWHVLKDGRVHRTFTSLMAAKGWLEHVLEHPESDRSRVAPEHEHEPDCPYVDGFGCECVR